VKQFLLVGEARRALPCLAAAQDASRPLDTNVVPEL
jgi:hypothetical protein